jgi:hypothetical protein
VAGYRVYRNGVLVATVTSTKWNDNLSLNGSSRTYYVVAFDAAGNVSAASNLVSAQ